MRRTLLWAAIVCGPVASFAAPAPKAAAPLADMGGLTAPADVTELANWVSTTRDAKQKAFVLIDKKNAHLYVFDNRAKLRGDTPILLGKAIGDDLGPDASTKPISKMTDSDKRTPAGRFLAQPGRNSHGEAVIWIDYKDSISMHRMRQVSEDEHRAERMASPTTADNRISYGCVNVPPAFFDKVLNTTVRKYGAYVYVLPETRTLQAQFGPLDAKQRASA